MLFFLTQLIRNDIMHFSVLRGNVLLIFCFTNVDVCKVYLQTAFSNAAVCIHNDIM